MKKLHIYLFALLFGALTITSCESYFKDINVNPDVPHPRWSQASHRVLGAGLFAAREPTLLFNGYGEQVAHLYKDLNLPDTVLYR